MFVFIESRTLFEQWGRTGHPIRVYNVRLYNSYKRTTYLVGDKDVRAALIVNRGIKALWW